VTEKKAINRYQSKSLFNNISFFEVKKLYSKMGLTEFAKNSYQYHMIMGISLQVVSQVMSNLNMISCRLQMMIQIWIIKNQNLTWCISTNIEKSVFNNTNILSIIN
jgi:hypothetical protein